MPVVRRLDTVGVREVQRIREPNNIYRDSRSKHLASPTLSGRLERRLAFFTSVPFLRSYSGKLEPEFSIHSTLFLPPSLPPPLGRKGLLSCLDCYNNITCGMLIKYAVFVHMQTIVKCVHQNICYSQIDVQTLPSFNVIFV